MNDEERAARLARLKKTRGRIDILLLRQAEMGPLFPAAMHVELREAQHDERTLMAELGLDTALPDTERGAALAERVLALEFQMKSTQEVVRHALTAINGQLAEIRDSAKEWRQTERTERVERQEIVDVRFSRIELAIIGLAIVLAVLIGFLVTQ